MIDKTIEKAAWNFARKQWGEEAAWNFARKQWGGQIPHTLDKIAEPEEKSCTDTCIDDCSSQCKSQDFDTILKDSFRNERRLNIAAQIVAAIYSNHQAAKGFKSIEEIVRKPLDIANILIKESEKDGKCAHPQFL